MSSRTLGKYLPSSPRNSNGSPPLVATRRKRNAPNSIGSLHLAHIASFEGLVLGCSEQSQCNAPTASLTHFDSQETFEGIVVIILGLRSSSICLELIMITPCDVAIQSAIAVDSHQVSLQDRSTSAHGDGKLAGATKS